MTDTIIYECGICSHCHPWNWDGDCRDDKNRYADSEDYAERNGLSQFCIEVRSWEERVDADSGEAA